MKSNQTKNTLFTIATGTQIVTQLVGPVILCLLFGIWIDKIFHTTPWFLIIGVIIGFSTSIWNIYQKMIKPNS